MNASRSSKKQRQRAQQQNGAAPAPAAEGMTSGLSPTNIENLHIRTSRSPAEMYDESEEVELSLLGHSPDEEGRPKTNRQMLREEEAAGAGDGEKVKPPLTARDKRAIALLIVLCALLIFYCVSGCFERLG